MRGKLFFLLLVLAGLGAWTAWLARSRGHLPPAPPPEEALPSGEKEPPPPLQAGGPDFPDPSGWEKGRPKGGIFQVPIPPGWTFLEQRDLVNRAGFATGFLVAPSLKDTRRALVWFPYMPLLSETSEYVRTILAAYKAKHPPKVGLILYDHPDLGPLLRRAKWPFLPVTTPLGVLQAFHNEWFGEFFWEKYGIPRPAGFAMKNALVIRPGLAAAHLTFQLGPDRKHLKPVEGLAFLATGKPAPASGDWGMLLVFLQAPQGKWKETAPTLKAILAGLQYDPKVHLELVGERRALEVGLTRKLVRILPRLDLFEIFRKTSKRNP